ncbi:PEP-CTERM sorting domain-containing protein [Dechloromonas sp. XY25]|uniref:PEP-CTERM sorting domain-containing protein n=1 Tax=Dechloromonas hankyongensis TaxID=2908002 RepID=A0ABS9K1E0_9RHOO|nr:PEP-CTERM sorting domain-containing protein [Dechloromonas hankyongensis]MCG2576909.1 PEP-CTERM sorting domain-containing protein [Dechloromonas hankyongensis]
MKKPFTLAIRSTFLVALVVGMTSSHATLYTGSLYYTTYNGGQNVWSIGFGYDTVTNAYSLNNNTNIASTNGADGIIFGSNGNLLVGGQGSGNVYEVNKNTGSVVNTQNTGAPSFHLTLDPNGNKVYTSDFGGRLNTVAVPVGTGSTSTTITGGDSGVTQIAFGLNGAVFYVNGSPNGGGNLGTIDLSTGVTTRLYSSVLPAHGLIFDPFTNLITMFGAGRTGTMSALDGSGLTTSDTSFICDFDQGALNGSGIALVAGCGSLTLIDYTQSHDITHPDWFGSIFVNSFIDDVAPLIGAGSECGNNCGTVPEPGTIVLIGLGFLGFATSRRRKA